MAGAVQKEVKPSVFFNRYRYEKKISEGSFGVIVVAYDMVKKHNVAIKFEKERDDSVKREVSFYTKLLRGGVGIPRVIYFGMDNNITCRRGMVMELLGPDLQTLMEFCGGKFSLKTVLMLADQLISRMEFIHHKCIIQRDVKPDNFCMGCGKNAHIVYMVDLGMAKQYRSLNRHEHIPYRGWKGMRGTCRYVSVNVNDGIGASRRDDMEALGYMFVYFLRGKLPWQGIRASNEEDKYEKVANVKRRTPLETLCDGLPSAFHLYLKYCRSLKFEQQPDYSNLKNLFKEKFEREGYQYDMMYDWNVKHVERKRAMEKDKEKIDESQKPADSERNDVQMDDTQKKEDLETEIRQNEERKEEQKQENLQEKTDLPEDQKKNTRQELSEKAMIDEKPKKKKVPTATLR